MTRRQIAFAVMGFLSLTGCVRLLPEPPPASRIYPLNVASLAPSTLTAPIVLGVARPNMPQAISGLDISWRRNGEIVYAPRAVWSARAPDALQGLMVATIDAQDLVIAGIRVGEGPRSDYDLRWDVSEFEVLEAPGRLEARFSASLKLVDARTRSVVAARDLTRTLPLSRRSEGVGVVSLQRIAADAAVEAGSWAAAAAQTHRASLSAPIPAPQPSAASINR